MITPMKNTTATESNTSAVRKLLGFFCSDMIGFQPAAQAAGKSD
jgi:hypothetical protein